MKKTSKSRKRRIYVGRAASLMMAFTMLLSSSQLSWALAATEEHKLDTEDIVADFTAERDESVATETIEIEVSANNHDAVIHGIVLPDGTYVNGDTAVFVAKENGDYDFRVIYDEVIQKDEPTIPELPTPTPPAGEEAPDSSGGGPMRDSRKNL